MAAPSPVSDDVSLVTYEILVDGSAINGSYPVRSIMVDRAVNRIPIATFVISDGDPAAADFPISDSNDFKPGNTVEIKAGYSSTNATIFNGIITRHSVRASNHSTPELVIECRDKAVKMTVARKNAFFGDGSTATTDSDLMSSVISDAGLTASVGSTSPQLKEVIQYYATDWDFVLTRAQVNSMVVIVDNGTVDVNKPEVSGSAVLQVTYGTDILAFNAELNSISQLSEASASAWDPSTQAVITGSSTKPSVNSQGNITSSTLADVLGVSDFTLQSTAPLTSDDLSAWASAQLQRSWLNRITGSVEFQGSSLAKPGVIIDIAGVGARFNGSAYVGGVQHLIQDGNWTTTARFGLGDEWFNETPDIVAPLSSGQLPGINGLQTGVVKQINEDPDNETRIEVQVPILQDDSKSVWARLSTFYATNGAGAVFYPEVGDEVVLGFFNDDPRYPVILGSMYSKKNVTATTPDEENTIKAITTKGGNEITITDKDSEQSIAISTPEKNNVVFSDKEKSIVITDQNSNKIEMDDSGIKLTDKNGNTITMSSGGIELKTNSDITLQATGNVNLKATGSLNGEATSDATIKGMNATLQGTMAAKVSGGTSAEVSGSLNCKISGAMVNIN